MNSSNQIIELNVLSVRRLAYFGWHRIDIPVCYDCIDAVALDCKNEALAYVSIHT
jgi:hypothetical protein